MVSSSTGHGVKLTVDAQERHVFIPVAFGGAPGEVQAYLMYNLYTGSPPPLGDPHIAPDLPEPVTSVWIASSSARYGVRWDRSDWSVFNARPKPTRDLADS